MNRQDYIEQGRMLRKIGKPRPVPPRTDVPGARYLWRREALIAGWNDEDEFLQRHVRAQRGGPAV